jgi:hypothetical protein
MAAVEYFRNFAAEIGQAGRWFDQQQPLTR